MKEFIRKYRYIILFTITGAVGGFLYWRFIGCQSGTCPIKSRWYLSTLWGSAFGYLSGSILLDLIEKIADRRKVKSDRNRNEI